MTMTAIPDREFWTPEQAATEVFQLDSAYTLKKGVRERRFPHTRIGRTVRFSRAQLVEIAKLLEQPATNGEPPKPRARRTVTQEDLAGLRPSARSARRHSTP